MTSSDRLIGWQRRCLVWGLLMVLTACGGNDDPVAGPSAVTALPEQLSVAAPPTRQALAAEVAFGSNVVDPDAKLVYSWDFGDGSSSTAPAPRHGYAQPGAYTVKLTVRNEAGSTVSSSHTITVADLAIVAGRACSGPDQGGWCWQNPLPQGNPINAYHWLDERRGWAVGDTGALLKTSDGGQTWTAVDSGTRSQLRRVLFVNDQVGWVAGNNGLLLKTADGGATWQAVSVGTSIDVATLGAADATTAWVAAGSTVYRTRDGGVSWQVIPPPANAFSAPQQVGPDTLWALRFGTSDQVLSRSTDAGATWQDVGLPALAAGVNRSFGALRFVDGLRGILSYSEFGFDSAAQEFVSRSVTILTLDGGASWRPVARPADWPAFASAQVMLTPDGTVFMLTDFSSRPGIDYSTDGGATWQVMAKPASVSGVGIDAIPYSSTRLLLRGVVGPSYMTGDAGANWTELLPTASFAPITTSVWFFNAREGLALVDNGASLRTTDGGQTWRSSGAAAVCCSASWRGLAFTPDGVIGWAIAADGQVYRSTDRGQHWLAPVPQTSDPLGLVLDVQFIDANQGWVLADNFLWRQGLLFNSSDGGTSWRKVQGTSNLAGMRALRFADASHGVAVGAAGVAMVSSDGGANWRPRPTGSDRYLLKLAFADAQTVLAVGDGGTILRSTDRGHNWSRVPSPTASTLTDLRFVNASVGHAVGNQGVLLVTQDGGLTWRDASPATELGLRAVHFINADTGWAVGDNGAILATISGGR